MFIYNVTVNVNHSVHEAWLEWALNEHIHAVMKTNCFTRFQFLKLLEQDESGGPTYIAQYFAESKALYNRYIELFSAQLRKEHLDKWGNNFVAFRTLLEVIK